MENYIVRIYRRDDSDPDAVMGVVESVEDDRQQTFDSIEQLSSLLASTDAYDKAEMDS